MHKLLLALALALAALFGALAWMLTTERVGAASGARPRAAAPERVERAAERAAAPSSGAAVTTTERLEPEPLPRVSLTGQGLGRSRVFGLVADLRGAPIAGAEAHLSCQGRWVDEDVYPEPVPSSFLAVTGADGRFAFDVPTPTADEVTLRISAGIHNRVALRCLGIAGGRNQDRLRGGSNDLGTILMDDAGAVSGRVTDASGAPLPGVMINGGFGAGRSTTGEQGGYELRCLAPGRTSLRASCPGFLDLVRDGIDVEAGRTTTGIDFVLSKAVTLAGRVVGEDGTPLPGVSLRGMPGSRNGSGASGMSGEDGTFTVELPQDEPYSLGAWLEGYEEIGCFSAPERAPGTRGIELVLKRQRLHTFRVRDALTRAPVERFGLMVEQVRSEPGEPGGWGARGEPELGDHPGGVVQLGGDPALCDYAIRAPGYGPRSGPVALEANGEQVIDLFPEAALTGRLTRSGEPVPKPWVRVEADSLPIDPRAAPHPAVGSAWRRDLDAFAGRERIEHGAADGTFRLSGLAPGTYELELSGAGVAPLTLERIELRAGEVRDLGALAAETPGEIAGVVLLRGLPRGGLSVFLRGRFSDAPRALQITDAGGAFAFGRLEAGTHELSVAGKDGVILDGPSFTVELGSAERRRVELDLGPRVPCRITVRARLSGPALAGIYAVAQGSDPAQGFRSLGVLDADGRAEGYIAAEELLCVELRGPSGLTLAADARPRRLQPGEAIEVELEVALGSLLAWLPMEGGEGPQVLTGLRRAGEGDSDWRTTWTACRLDDGIVHLELGPLAPADYELKVWRRHGNPWTAAASVQAGRATTVAVRSP